MLIQNSLLAKATRHEMKKIFPKMYALTKLGKVKWYLVEVLSDSEDKAIMRCSTATSLTAKVQTNDYLYTEGKNIGRANETNPLQQAMAEAESTIRKLRDEGYNEDIPNVSNKFNTDSTGSQKPMLAKSYSSWKWDKVLVQPKLDGCVQGKTMLITDKGLLPISEIVKNKLKINVLSYNKHTRKTEFKSVINWFDNGESHSKFWMDITPKDGKRLRCTYNHKFLTQRGWCEAEKLNPATDILYVKNYSHRFFSLLAGTLLGDSNLVIEKRGTGTSYRLNFSHTNLELFQTKIRLLNLSGKITRYTTGYGSLGFRFISNALTNTGFPIKIFYKKLDNNSSKRRDIPYKELRSIITKESLSLWIADDGSVRYNNNNSLTPVLQIATHNHSDKQIIEMCKYFKSVWFVNPTAQLDKRVNTESGISGKFLNFTTKDTLYLLNQLRDCQIQGVEYKYYFPRLDYMKPLTDELKKTSFTKKHVQGTLALRKYDIEIADNHNYLANGIVIHNCRCLTKKVNNKIILTTRGGKNIPTLPHIEEALKDLPEGIVLDGELYIHGMSLQNIISAVKKVNEDTINVKYRLYDLAIPNVIQAFRHDQLQELLKEFDANIISGVPTHTVKTEKEMMELFYNFLQEGFEGAMIRVPDGIYEFGFRSSSLIKYKEFLDAEFKIIDVEEATGRDTGTAVFRCTKNEDIYKVFIMNTQLIQDKKWLDKFTFTCRPKGTLEQRAVYYKNRKHLIGKDLTVKYQALSDSGTVIFPVGICVRDYE